MSSSDYDGLLLKYLTGGTTTLALALGNKLGLIQAICSISSEKHHASPEEVAERANCKPRYIREWLACLACSNIIQVDEEERFWVTEEQKKILLNSPWMPMFDMIPLFSDVRGKLEEAIDKDSPRLGLDYSDFSKFYEMMGGITVSAHKDVIVPKLLPEIGHGILESLNNDSLKCLDVGCGNGFHVQLLAKAFPKSKFIGIDLVQEAIDSAEKQKLVDKTENSSYFCMDAAKLPKDWENSFDFVTIFDACHDQTRPDLGLKEVYRVLKPGGIFAMIEIRGTGNIFQDKKESSERSSLFYGCSLFHCLPVGSNCSGAKCYGSMWGVKRAIDLLENTGFQEISYQNPAYLPVNTVYVSKK